MAGQLGTRGAYPLVTMLTLTDSTGPAPLALHRKKARLTRNGKKAYQWWGNGLGPSYSVTLGVERGSAAKTSACSAYCQITNPHWDTRLFPALDGETNDQRDVRITALAEAAGASYKHGIISWTGRGKTTADGVEKAQAVLAAMGIVVTAELGAF